MRRIFANGLLPWQSTNGYVYYSNLNGLARAEWMQTMDAADWSDIQVFLALMESGSLSRAARALGVSQPTLTRRLQRLEARLGARLFERSAGQGVRPTDAAHGLVPSAQAMAQHAAQWARSARSSAREVAGAVRVTASEMVSVFVLPPLVARARDELPRLAWEIVASDAIEDLRERRADIALRMTAPQEPDLIARRLRDEPLGFYAAHSYLQRRGEPHPNDIRAHAWVGYDRVELLLRGFAQAGHAVTRDLFCVRCDHTVVQWQAVRAGIGIGVGLARVAEQDAGLQPVLTTIHVPPLPMWLVTRRDMRQSPRLKAAFDFLARALA